MVDIELIRDDDVLLRRVPAIQITPAPGIPPWRVTSGDWDDPNLDDPSVYCERLLLELGLDSAAVLDGYPHHSLASILAQQVREGTPALKEGGVVLDVVHRPDETDSHPRAHAHCAIIGMPTANQQRKKAREPLARRCQMLLVKKDAQELSRVTWAAPGYGPAAPPPT